MWPRPPGRTARAAGCDGYFPAAGARVGGEVAVNTIQVGNQQYAEVSALDGGGFIVSWLDDVAAEARFQRFDASGARSGTEVTLPLAPDTYILQSTVAGTRSSPGTRVATAASPSDTSPRSTS